MKKMYFKSMNQVTKVILALLGFTLASMQCLAQYMAMAPSSIRGKILVSNDTKTRFKIIINNRDVIYTDFKNNYEFNYDEYPSIRDTFNLSINDDTPLKRQKYISKDTLFILKPNEYYLDDIEIPMKEK